VSRPLSEWQRRRAEAVVELAGLCRDGHHRRAESLTRALAGIGELATEAPNIHPISGERLAAIMWILSDEAARIDLHASFEPGELARVVGHIKEIITADIAAKNA
jgi:hypothetical protein